MGRPVILGNGSLTVGLNEHGLVHDFYYPYVGLDNLTTARSIHHMIGVWVDGTFSWVDDGSWRTNVDFENDALISKVQLVNDYLGISLDLQDFVDFEHNVFGRRISVRNTSDRYQHVRLFMHQVFQISRSGRADTAMYVPDEHYILDYKGRCSLLVYGQDSQGRAYDQFAIGNYGIEGKEGTFKDAEDGELSGSAVEHGGVDSVMRFSLSLKEGETETVDYWIAAADSQRDAEKLHRIVKEKGLRERLERTRLHWQDWLAISKSKRHGLPGEYQDAVSKSLIVIKSHIDKRGGIIASCDSSIYNYGRDYYSYVWPRDGAYAIWPLIRLGYTEEPKKFFEFCRDILTQDGYLMHKYQPDKAIGSTWHPMLHGHRSELPIQEDETAIVLCMLGEYYKYSQDEDFVRGLYQTYVKPAANFMAEFIDEKTGLPHASYDLWEQKFLTTTYTTATVYGALRFAVTLAEKFEFADDAAKWDEAAKKIHTNLAVFFDPSRDTLRKGFLLQDDGSLKFDNTLDISSLYGVMMFDYQTPDQDALHLTVGEVERKMLDISPSGGTPRYEYDDYFRSDPPFLGNPWFVTTLWMAQYYARTNQTDRAKHYLDWTLQHALPSGVLSEQVNPNDGSIISVTPLVWSHAEVINTALDIAQN